MRKGTGKAFQQVNIKKGEDTGFRKGLGAIYRRNKVGVYMGGMVSTKETRLQKGQGLLEQGP